MTNRNLGERLEWLLDHELVPYIKKMEVTNNDKTVMIYRHIIEELKEYKGDNSNMPTMQDIQNFLGLKYTQLRIGNSRPHVIIGNLQTFKKFLCTEIKELETQQTLNPTIQHNCKRWLNEVSQFNNISIYLLTNKIVLIFDNFRGVTASK